MTNLDYADEEIEEVMPQEAEPASGVQRLLALYQSGDIAGMIEDEVDGKQKLALIGERAIRHYKLDEDSRKEWLEKNKESLKLARQVADEKNYPWPKAANIIYPLVSEAAIQFNARAYPAIVDGKNIVKPKIQGNDPEGAKKARGERVARHMSWQLSEESTEWEDDTDRLLIMLPIAGSVFRKWWFDAELGRNRSEIISAEDFIINDGCKTLGRAPRKSFRFTRYPHEIEEKTRGGDWLDVELGQPTEAGEDEDAPHQFIEHYCRLDLDDDGYGEPYAVTVHIETQQVMRIDPCFNLDRVTVGPEGKIVAIESEVYFAHYCFIPDPDGGFYGLGLGQLLFGTNKAINGVINMLMDAGHMASLGGGFMGKGATLQGGSVSFKPGEWKKVDVTGQQLAQNIVPLPVREPSTVLFSLLGLLIESGKSLAATKDILTGENVNSQMPASLGLAMIEQGLKVFSAIYKRVHRALKDELGILYRLNGLYLNPNTYFTLLDTQEQVGPEDYAADDLDVVPVTDPSVVTDMQRLGRAQFLMQFMGNPAMNQQEIIMRVLEAASIEDVPRLFAEQPPVDPKVKEAETKANHEFMRIKIEGAVALADILVKETQALKNIAEAEAKEVGAQMSTYQAHFNSLKAMIEQESGIGGQGDAGANPGMAEGPDNGGGMGLPQGLRAGPGGGMGLGGGGGPAGTGAGGDLQGVV